MPVDEAFWGSLDRRAFAPAAPMRPQPSETATAPMHVASMAIYDQSSAPGGRVTFKQIMAHVAFFRLGDSLVLQRAVIGQPVLPLAVAVLAHVDPASRLTWTSSGTF